MKNVIQDRQQLVVKSNKLLQNGRYNLTLQQQRILLYMISQIKPDQTEFEPCDISIMDFCELCGIEGKNYADIKKAVNDLCSVYYWFEDNGITERYQWISNDKRPQITKGTGIITLCLSASMRDYLLNLREKFTSYELHWILTFRRKYSIRLYEYVCYRHFDKLKPYTFAVALDELQAVMGAENYDRFSHFHEKALAPAVSEVDTVTDKKLSYELIKRGKTVAAVQFTIETQPALERVCRDKAIQRLLGYDPKQLTRCDREYYGI